MNRIDSGEGMTIYMKSNITERQIEIARKMYPSAEIIKIIDLPYDETAKVLSKRDNGEMLRNELRLSGLDKSEYKYEIRIPTHIKTWNPSHFIGMFKDSIKILGIDKFRKKYTFVSSNISVTKDIEESIEWMTDSLSLL